MSPLSEDLIQIENYLSLQQYRYSNKLDYSITISDDIKDIKIPKLLLQPLIENIFKHGFSDFAKGGTITISGFTQDGHVILTIEDGGIGIPPEKLPKAISSGFGLEITRERIKYAYGDGCGIKIQSRPGKGTKVILKILWQPKTMLGKFLEED